MFNTLNRHHTRSAKWENGRGIFKDLDYLMFSVADSDYPTAPEIIKRLKDRVEHGAYGYTMTDDEYFKAIVDWFQRRYQTKIDSSWILPSSKVLALLSTAIDVYSKPKDKILIQTPVYHVFYPLINYHKRTLITNPLLYENGYYTMDFNDLEARFKQGVKVMVLCNPHNPVGRVWSYQELERLVDLCKTYDVLILSDEIHADVIMTPYQFTSINQFTERYHKLMVIHAPSKTFNIAGLHSAYAVVPSKLLREKLKSTLIKRFMFGSNTFAIEALITAYSSCDNWVDAQNKHVQENYQTLKAFLSKYYSKSVLLPLEGTYLAWLDLRAYQSSSKKLAEIFKNVGIVLSEGLTFGAQCDGFMRMNLAVSKEQLEEGLKRFRKAL